MMNIFVKNLADSLSKILDDLGYMTEEINRMCQAKKGGSTDLLSKASKITSVIATIGCFAGFAMSSICPIAGWAIFGVCCASFAVNLANGVRNAVTA